MTCCASNGSDLILLNPGACLLITFDCLLVGHCCYDQQQEYDDETQGCDYVNPNDSIPKISLDYHVRVNAENLETKIDVETGDEHCSWFNS